MCVYYNYSPVDIDTVNVYNKYNTIGENDASQELS